MSAFEPMVPNPEGTRGANLKTWLNMSCLEPPMLTKSEASLKQILWKSGCLEHENLYI